MMRRPKLLDTMRDYSWPLFRADALAGVSVALVALPLCIPIAIASGRTPFVGLVTAIIGGFVISATSGSRVQIGGRPGRSEEHPSEIQSLMRNSSAGFCLTKKIKNNDNDHA